MLVHGNVDAATNEKIEGIIAGGFAGDQTARSRAGTVEIPVKIAVCATEQRLDKWFEMRKAELTPHSSFRPSHFLYSGCANPLAS